jgi:hypothetical protein
MTVNHNILWQVSDQTAYRVNLKGAHTEHLWPHLKTLRNLMTGGKVRFLHVLLYYCSSNCQTNSRKIINLHICRKKPSILVEWLVVKRLFYVFVLKNIHQFVATLNSETSNVHFHTTKPVILIFYSPSSKSHAYYLFHYIMGKNIHIKQIR